MGYEWHDRQRDAGGRFAKHLRAAGLQQFHFRAPDEVAEIIRTHALDAQEEIGEYILKAVAQRALREGTRPADG